MSIDRQKWGKRIYNLELLFAYLLEMVSIAVVNLIKLAFILFVIYSIIGASLGTTYTNLVSLEYIFPPTIAKMMAVSLTIAYSVIALSRKRILMWVALVLIFITSSYLAINAVSSRRIVNQEDRIKTDPILEYWNNKRQKLNDTAIRKDNIYTQILYDKRILINGSGATDYRLQSQKAEAERREAEIRYQERLQVLSNVGSIQDEAAIETWNSLFNIFRIQASPRILTTAKDVIFSAMNDVMLYVLWICFPLLVGGFSLRLRSGIGGNFPGGASGDVQYRRSQNVHKSEQNERSQNVHNGERGERSGEHSTGQNLPRNSEHSGGENLPQNSEHSGGSQAGSSERPKKAKRLRDVKFDQDGKNAEMIRKVTKEHPDWSQIRISEEAARRVGRANPFGRTFVYYAQTGQR